MSGKRFLWLASMLIAVIFVASTLLFLPRLSSVRADFTQNGLYSLSGGTKTTLSELAEPIDITFFYTRQVGQKYPKVRAYAARVRELLAAYESKSGGNIRLVEVDPKPFSEAEDTALAAGLTAVETNGDDPLYFGLIGTNAVDDQRVIPFLAPEREATLEYDLTRLIARLDRPQPKTVGVITSLQGMTGVGLDNGYGVLRDMAKSYIIQPIAPDFVYIPPDVDVLVVAHAPELTERQLWLVDQFILHKGRALILVDPASKTAQAGGLFNASDKRPRSDLGVLGRRWGVTLSMDAVADIANALPVGVEDEDGRAAIASQPLFIATPPQTMSDESLITADLTRAVNFGAAGALTISETGDATFSPLITTSVSPSYIDASKAVREMSPADVVQAYESRDSALILAGRLSGNLQTAFPDGAPLPDGVDDPVLAGLEQAASDDIPPHIDVSAVPAEVIIIADSDVLDDGFYINPNGGIAIADNATLILNALDTLSGGAQLLSLRSRAPSLRPMRRVDAMRRAAELEYLDEQQRLEIRLAEAQTRLQELQEVGASGGFFEGDLSAELTDEEAEELASLREDIVKIRASSRSIERAFRRDIDGLEATLKAINIWGGPLLVLLIGLLVWRGQKRGPRRMVNQDEDEADA